VLVDDTVATIGSANLDMRSLFLNYEVAVFCTSPAEAAALTTWLESMFPDCIALADASRAKLMLEAIARLVSPLQ
jgi:cardiolipin synthase